jgi:hypothetical protein
MSIPSLIFWLIFVLPLIALMTWIMLQDKRKGVFGLVVLFIIVIAATAYTFLRMEGIFRLLMILVILVLGSAYLILRKRIK